MLKGSLLLFDRRGRSGYCDLLDDLLLNSVSKIAKFAFARLLTMLVFSSALKAQTHGYGFLGATVGGSSSGLDGAFRYGVGGNVSLAPRLTAGAEIGGLQKDGAGLIGSAKLGFHFRSRINHGLDPFVTGGVSYVRKSGEGGVFGNVGSGVHYWFRPRLAIRAEFVAYPSGSDLNTFSEFRVGIAIR